MARDSFRRLRLPTRFQEATLESLDPKQFGSVLQYAKLVNRHVGEGHGLLLAGKPGVGKTWAISALTRSYVQRSSRPDYEFVTAPDMFENLSDFGERYDDYREQPWMATYRRVQWLVINDLGKESRSGKLASQIPTFLGRIIRARSEERLTTHITTNLTEASFREAYGETIVSLLLETTMFETVLGRDRRKAS